MEPGWEHVHEVVCVLALALSHEQSALGGNSKTLMLAAGRGEREAREVAEMVARSP